MKSKRERFLEAYAELGNVAAAARTARCSRQQHYQWLREPGYEALFRAAHEEGMDALEGEARRRALHGVVKPTLYKGMPCYEPLTRNGRVVMHRWKKGGKSPFPVLSDKRVEIREYSDTLLIFLLKGGRPAKYNEFKGELADLAATALARGEDVDMSRLTKDEFEVLRGLWEKVCKPGPNRAESSPAAPDRRVLPG